MKKPAWMRILHMMTLTVLIGAGFAFGKSAGLVISGDKTSHVTDLLSLGSDDNITIEFSVLLFIPLLILSLARITKPMNLAEYACNDAVILAQTALLFCIEAGSITDTLLYDGNIPLILWGAAFIFLFCQLQLFYFKRKKIVCAQSAKNSTQTKKTPTETE